MILLYKQKKDDNKNSFAISIALICLFLLINNMKKIFSQNYNYEKILQFTQIIYKYQILFQQL